MLYGSRFFGDPKVGCGFLKPSSDVQYCKLSSCKGKVKYAVDFGFSVALKEREWEGSKAIKEFESHI